MSYEHKTQEELQHIWDSSEKKFCKKNKSFFAEVVEQDTEVVTLCIGEQGQIFQETSNIAHKGDVLITQYIDFNNILYKNQYIVTTDNFRKIYFESDCYVCYGDSLTDTWFTVHPMDDKLPLKTVVELVSPITFEPTWGGEMKAMAGAFLVKEEDGFYCINPVEFYATHKFVENVE